MVIYGNHLIQIIANLQGYRKEWSFHSPGEIVEKVTHYRRLLDSCEGDTKRYYQEEIEILSEVLRNDFGMVD